MWIIRTHKIGQPYSESYRRVRNRYVAEVRRGILPTVDTMNEWIEKKMPERPNEATFSVEVPENIAEACMVESSMETYYKDLTRGEEVKVIGKRTRKRVRCVICMTTKHTKIKLACDHIFHRKCIDEWARWKNTCPICQMPLKQGVVK